MPSSITSGIAHTASVCATRNAAPMPAHRRPKRSDTSTADSRPKRSNGRMATNSTIAIAGSGQPCSQNRSAPETTWLPRDPASSSTRYSGRITAGTSSTVVVIASAAAAPMPVP